MMSNLKGLSKIALAAVAVVGVAALGSRLFVQHKQIKQLKLELHSFKTPRSQASSTQVQPTPYTSASDFAKHAMTLREQALPEVKLRKTEDLSPEEQTLVDAYDKAASRSASRAQLALAQMYLAGRGVAKDERRAAEILKKAADEGDALAEVDLGWLYHEGKGVPQDYCKAAELYGKAATQGFAVGQAYLASQYAEGEGVPKDYRKAVDLFHKALDQQPHPNVLNEFAWFLATCPEASQRNGKQAVEYATKACELTEWKVRNFLATLAAAYAEMGDFDKAVEYEKQAMQLPGDYPSGEELERSLKLYQQHSKWRPAAGGSN